MGRPYFTYKRPAALPPSAKEGGLHLVSCMQLGVARHARRPQNRLSNEAERRSALPKWIMGGMEETDSRRTRESRGKHVITPTDDDGYQSRLRVLKWIPHTTELNSPSDS